MRRRSGWVKAYLPKVSSSDLGIRVYRTSQSPPSCDWLLPRVREANAAGHIADHTIPLYLHHVSWHERENMMIRIVSSKRGILLYF